MNQMNYCVTETPEKDNLALNIQAPYSAAAQKENSLAFYKRARKEPAAVHAELNCATDDLVQQINSRLPQIISIADPYANPGTVSEAHMREFSLPYLVKLLRGLDKTKGGVVHICPYCSVLLEKYGFVRVEAVSTVKSSYTEVLSDYAQTGRLVVTGHQCIHTKSINKVLLLHMLEDAL